MNFDAAIQSHIAWKRTLADYLIQPNGSLRPAEVGADNRCELGKWIHGNSAALGTQTEYQELKSKHAEFHRCASDVVRMADSGQSISEEIALGSNSGYSQASIAVVRALMKMKSVSH
ncbi:MAG: CZB domain-containing protein [Bryobacteraceae bacterium]